MVLRNNKMSINTMIIAICATIAFCAMVFGIIIYNKNETDSNTKIIEACVASGKSWVINENSPWFRPPEMECK